MQPAPLKRARFLHIVMGGWLLVVGSLGCTSPPEHGRGSAAFGALDTTEATDVPRDSVLAVLSRLNRTAFDSAFARLDAYAVTRHVRTEQLDTTGAVTAHRTRTLRYSPGTAPGTIQRADSAGRFQAGGLLARLTPAQSRRARPGNVAPQALPDRPAYLAARTQEAYRYALRRDSLLDGTPTHVVEAKARLDERGADQSIRYARLTIDRASHELVGLTTTRASQLLLFRERSQVTLRLRRAPDAAWVPHLTRVRALVDVPLRAPRQFRTVSAYYGYDTR
ncbi:MAG: hypothetical protein V5A20_04680 [Salinibacter sp.]|uniref:hypothetical protein n=1 Tax=Salinibacter sp. TaxID=2065818 RepID=UPI002FC31CF6